MGYAAIGFWLNAPKAANGNKKDDTEEKLSPEEKEALLSRARGALENYFGKGEAPFGVASAAWEGEFVRFTVQKLGSFTQYIHTL